MRRIDRVAAAAALIAVGLAILGAAAGPATSATNQSGEKNFAGPAAMCPGNDWNCVGPEAFPVSQDGTENVIVCMGDTAACADSSQNGESNKIECVDEQSGGPSAIQTCGPFDQSGGRNEAVFRLSFTTDDGSTQCAVQTGEIAQDGEENQLKADFRIVQTTTSGATQAQDGRQVLEADQEADEKNQSDVDQVQIQKASGDAATQNQNTGAALAACGGAPPDCNPTSAGPTQPVACLSLDQTVFGGSENISKLLQDVKQEAETTTAVASQQQGTFGTGSDARVHQEAPDDGKNVDVADQKVEQKVIAPNDGESAFQQQVEDPQCCGFGSQLGGTGNEESINQTVKQEGGVDPFQTGIATAIGFSPTGKCIVNQKVENDGGTADQTPSSEPCTEPLVASAACFSGGEGGGCDTASGEEVAICAEGFEPVFDEETGRPECVEVGEPTTSSIG
jgi:hypothetical protein